MFTVTPILREAHHIIPMFQVVREATSQVVLVDKSEDHCRAVAQVLQEVIEFKAGKLLQAGFPLVATALMDPKVVDRQELFWMPVETGVHYVARLDNLWTARVRQHTLDGMFELTLENPRGGNVGEPVLCFSVEHAKRRAYKVYMCRFPKDLENKLLQGQKTTC